MRVGGESECAVAAARGDEREQCRCWQGRRGGSRRWCARQRWRQRTAASCSPGHCGVGEGWEPRPGAVGLAVPTPRARDCDLAKNERYRRPDPTLNASRRGEVCGGGGGGGERIRKETMQALARASRGIAAAVRPSAVEAAHGGQLQQARGIVVQVRDGNLDRALSVMERKIRSSGMERLIRARTHHHVKDSEKRVLARKALMQRVKSQELGKKLREILIKKIRGQ
uniref:Ribosomal protein S21 n=4 Tax=Setaria TaxID=4554 RepID=K4AES7_SETIT